MRTAHVALAIALAATPSIAMDLTDTDEDGARYMACTTSNALNYLSIPLEPEEAEAAILERCVNIRSRLVAVGGEDLASDILALTMRQYRKAYAKF